MSNLKVATLLKDANHKASVLSVASPLPIPPIAIVMIATENDGGNGYYDTIVGMTATVQKPWSAMDTSVNFVGENRRGAKVCTFIILTEMAPLPLIPTIPSIISSLSAVFVTMVSPAFDRPFLKSEN